MIEVAVSSLEIDRVKALIYSEAAVHEYWIVCTETKQVEVYRRPGGAEGYQETIVATPGVRVELAILFR